MWRSLGKHYMVRQSAWLEGIWFEKLRPAYSTMTQAQSYERVTSRAAASPRLDEDDYHVMKDGSEDPGGLQKLRIGENISRRDKFNFLLKTLFELKDNKEAVYGALDAWVAWEQNFPIGPLRRALVALEKEQQWHRVIQVIKWMLSKGQGNTNGTYTQLIRALDMDHRAEEAHRFWVKKIGNDLHSVPWQLCSAMISIYYRNNMLDDLVKLFKNLEAFDRKPTDKSVVQKVADAYEMLGRPDEKHRILDKYNDLFTESPKKSRKYSSPKKGKK
ncbi:pentatricopeptide repeat-containing protein At4g18975, chloroplastic [Punica granatum]|uniref:Pentatricopeptide repeat-containing protein At4g18975, chloroplastic n=1 Tax=Punica granatum TaxID=22663 RepID=A0A218VVD6_PUNGR|nr:pentatricopeptide repeat-containing protein At4g18975, chloroplastic [Punica granatum]OWM64050.1 hypothetical protein CDL15_Pgr011505 [Punica granatum]